MQLEPHPNTQQVSVTCAVITISDTRSSDTDKSGQLIKELLLGDDHNVGLYQIIKDEPAEIQAQMAAFAKYPRIQAVIFNGGTGIAPRDTTYDVLEKLLGKTIPGFGELFRFLSYQEIGSRAMASRAVAGVYQSKVIFSLPGSSNAVQLGMERLILPELVHLVKQVTGNFPD